MNPLPAIFLPLTILGMFKPIAASDWPLLIGVFVWMIVLLTISAVCSSSENAFFSNKESDLEFYSQSNLNSHKKIIKILANPKKLLASMLLMNSLVNIAFIISSLFFYDMILNEVEYPWIKLIFDTLVVTLVILIFGEVVPKVYATKNYRAASEWLVYPMSSIVWMLAPFTLLLERLGLILERRSKSTGPVISAEEIADAIDLTTREDDIDQEKQILKGIVNMSNIQVKQIMRSRLDVVALNSALNYHEVLNEIKKSEFSRYPVFKETLDQVIGILNVKTLLPYIDELADFQWQKLIHKLYYVPENKPIDDLLNEFQQKRLHMAIVVDEFGGTSGIVTLEDLLEEVFGELNDEFDEETEWVQKINDQTYIFEGRCLLVDFLREVDLPHDIFNDQKYSSDSLAGLMSEELGKIPRRGEKIKIKGIQFIVNAADPKRVKKIKVIFPVDRNEIEQ
ncbi:MAG: gliding motility-associated protein GldE [Bacteroidia bacterium]|nr:gliding motility-associated protein GldE [Bacteroidia bacterium]